ncbi:acVLRF1 family peptidyl-tRNA hydrolase [Symbioplanes lichenis]|uniref:acVLRF1 family peptidyl-tRNA hydrolase n=1 Tax=Symbioplanes lichenis TaxID=1629072 RepID=UPI002738FD68|nr:acVLRF1 family peptidyl-tRNA hydrolase [Actinoplanes lichenis]
MSARPAAGGGRWVDVAPERLPRWLENFAARHGGYTAGGLTITGADGATAELFPPPGADGIDDLAGLAAAAGEPRRLGLLLARKGAVAVGVAEGIRLVASKVDTHYVQGRTAAGGWSQQRFARRRDNQAKAAAADGASIVGRLLLPEVKTLRAVVTGGDRAAVEAILTAPVLAPVLALRDERFLDVPEPRRAVLEEAVALARTIRVLVRDPAPGP